MKLKTKIDALQKLIAAETAKAEASKKVVFATGTLRETWADDERITRAALSARVAVREEWRANGAWRALDKPRRTWAAETKKWAEDQGMLAACLGASYSGDTYPVVQWGDKSVAYTTTGYGDKYSRSCKYSKINADHIAILCAEDVVRLDEHRPIAQASAAEGLPIIGLMGDGRFVWVRRKGKAIVSENGWIGCHAGTIYHSKKSAEAAQAGAKRKAKKVERERWEALHSRKIERRARLVSRLCGKVIATIADARAMGYCEPGIESFQAKHGIGDSASLPALVRTGNPDAIRLALKLARRVSVKAQKQATA